MPACRRYALSGAGPALAVLPQVGAGAERPPLRHPFLVVPPGEVEQLRRPGGHREGQHEVVERVRLLGRVRHDGPQPDEAGRQQREVQAEREAAGVVGHGPRPPGSGGGEAGDGAPSSVTR